MKYFTLMMMLMASINDCYSASVTTGSDPAIDLILVMLQEIKGDVAELTVKTDSLVATTESLQATIGVLSLKVRNNEDDIADLMEFKNTVETGTGSMDPAIQQQITDLSSNVTALTEENEEIQQQVVDLSIKEQNDYDGLNADITALNSTVHANNQEVKDLKNTVETETSSIQQQVTDLSIKEQSDYDELDADIAALNSTVQANYQELKGDVDNIAKTCGPLSNGYNYEFLDTSYTWNAARTVCQSKGGDLAYHGLDTLNGREQLLCGHFNLCDNGDVSDGSPYIGLRRDTTTRMFEYLDGELSPFDDQLWGGLDDYNQSYDQDCGHLSGIEHNNPNFLQAYSYPCNVDKLSICEIPC